MKVTLITVCRNVAPVKPPQGHPRNEGTLRDSTAAEALAGDPAEV
jgi:hypothetical protein